MTEEPERPDEQQEPTPEPAEGAAPQEPTEDAAPQEPAGDPLDGTAAAGADEDSGDLDEALDREAELTEDPVAPQAADAAGEPGEASKVEVSDEERAAPPKRAADAPAEEAEAPGAVGAAVEPQVDDAADRSEAAATAADTAEGGAADPDTRPAPAGGEKPAIPGADLEVDIVPEGSDPLGRGEQDVEALYAEAEEEQEQASEEAVAADEPVAQVAIDLGADARYAATGKRKSAIARVILRPGNGEYIVNGKPLDTYFPRPTLQRNIRQPLETVGYQDRMDVRARLQGGGVSAQAGALRHGIARALIDADPNLRGELKRRGFLTRDPREKERRKAGLKKARKRPQFSKR